MGAGAIGCLVGGQLAVAGHSVTLLGRAGLVHAVEHNGLRLKWSEGTLQTVFPKVIESLATISDFSAIDLVLVTVKSFDTAQAVAGLVGNLGSQTSILSLQNGVGNEEQLSQLFPKQPLIAGSITLPVAVPQVGTIVVSKNKGGIGLSPVNTDRDFSAISSALTNAGFVVKHYADYRSLKWSKLVMNMLGNGIPAILDMSPGQALAYPKIFDLELIALKEALAVMHAEKIDVVSLPAYPVSWLARALQWLPNRILKQVLGPVVIGGRGDKLPSLLLDLRRGRNQSEINVLNKVVVTMGESAGVSTPVNQTIVQILNGILNTKISKSVYRQNPDALIAAVQQNKA